MSEKRKQLPKRGHVLRVSDFAWDYISSRGEKTTRETIDLLIEELHDLSLRLEEIFSAKTYYILPRSRIVCESEAEAKGEAIRLAVRRGERKPDEDPVAVKVI